MTGRSTNHSRLLALTLALCLAACSNPTTPVTPVQEAAPDAASDTDTVIAPVPTEPDLSTTPEPVMEVSSDAQTAALNSRFGGLKSLGTPTVIPTGSFFPSNVAREAHADAAGNVYVAGSTTAAFGGQNLKGGSDGFLVKFNVTGQLQWVRLLGTTDEDVAIKVVPSPNGSVYVAGTTTGALFSAALDPNGTQARADLFLAKFDTNGNRLWGKQFGSNGLDSVSDMRVDSNGNTIVSGVVKNTLVGARGATGKGAFVVFAGPQGVLTSPRFYDVGIKTPGFVRMDRSLNAYVTSRSTISYEPTANPNTYAWQEHLTKFLADGTRQYELSSDVHGYKQSWSFLADSNGVTYLTGETYGYPDFFKRFDNGALTYGAQYGALPFAFATSAQAISNTETYVGGGSSIAKLGTGGIKLKVATVPTAENTTAWVQGFNLDRQGNIFVVGYQTSRDVNDNIVQQPFVAKYNSSFVLQ
jgi:hypothetical protein